MIYTLTLNPAFDLHYYLDSFKSGTDNFAHTFEIDAGGKGINVSRCLSALDVKNKAFFLSGEFNESRFVSLLNEYAVDYEFVTVNGRIRENISIHTTGRDDTRVCVNGFEADFKSVNKLFDKISAVIQPNDILVVSGRLPHSISKQSVIEVLKVLKKHGVKLFVDCASFNLNDLRELKPYFIKPNRNEAEALTGNVDALESAKLLFDLGVENVCVTLGKDGAIYMCSQGCFDAIVQSIDVVSTVGAGDAFVAGFAAATAGGLLAEQRFKVAMASGGASVLEKGTNPPKLSNLINLFSTSILSKRLLTERTEL